MPGKHDIYVFEDNGTFYVRPTVAMVGNGEGKKVRIRNLTTYSVQVEFPKGPVDPTKKPMTAGSPPSCTIEPSRSVALDLDPSKTQVYEYSVYVMVQATLKVPALANSWPKIIVDP
jgi:hypothetical protein